jgi:hypothetical protein
MPSAVRKVEMNIGSSLGIRRQEKLLTSSKNHTIIAIKLDLGKPAE